jgi:asparagine synthetase B (glutamine-hydrolysing)
MCGFGGILHSQKKKTKGDYLNLVSSMSDALQHRGPDSAGQWADETIGIALAHRRLAILDLSFAGHQPMASKSQQYMLVFNGEIYNYTQNNKDCKSDGYFILDQYFEHKENFVKYLDGEFALALIDFNTKQLYFSGDLFITKPIFIAKEGKEIGIASYKSALKALGFQNPKRLEPNKFYNLSIDTFELQENNIYTWDLNQTVNTYDSWIDAFKESLLKRTQQTRGQFLVPLSSGHDSGAIVCGLQSLVNNNNFLTYSFVGNEDGDIIRRRLANHDNKIFETGISLHDKNNAQKEINEIAEHFFYGPTPDINIQEGISDIGAIGLYSLLKSVKETHQIKVQLSGQGGDEVMTNIPSYGFQTSNPPVWPDDLTAIFPWGNFYFGANWSYLNKEESIAGSLGIETRYPLLDKKVVQAFLNLTPQLKNQNYKAPICNLFTKFNFPFINGKLGFNVQVF